MRVLIGEKHELLRYGLIQLLKDVKTVDSMVMADNASELVYSLKKYSFDLVVIGEQLANGGGLRSVVALLERQPDSCKNVIMYKYPSMELEELVHTNKLQGIFYEQAPLNELMLFFQQVLKGEKMILSMGGDDKIKEPFSANLSSREKEILNMKVRGYSVVDTAKLLNISPKTVENHRRNIRKKLNITKNNQWFEWGKRLEMI